MGDLYLWESNGGCSRCDAMNGYHYDEEPTRPHKGCDCEITLVETYTSGECYELDVEGGSWSWDGDAKDLDASDPIMVQFSFTVQCWHGGGVSDSRVVEIPAEDVFVNYKGELVLDDDDWPMPDFGATEDIMEQIAIEHAEEVCDCN